MDNSVLVEFIRKKCAEYCEIPMDKIELDAKIMGTYDLTSLDFLSLCADIEEEYNIQIEDEEILDVETLTDLVKIVERKMN
jgi:acyl carrier protein